MAGSLGYAERLKNRKRLGGQLGATEYMEDVQTVQSKVQQLADMVAAAKTVFLFTGAGISTSAGIPDFRGPSGIWTLKKKKMPINAPLTPFEHARPTLTHMVIAALVASGKASYVCSQNVDSLHLRSGVPRGKVAELHGNCFAERCSVCKYERVRDFQVETLNFKPTGRTCTRSGCGGAMVDNVLDWDSALPDDELDASLEAAQAADVCVVLGSSLQIQPANEIPLHTADAKGKVVIVNLQKTPRDRCAALILRARVDVVMARLALQLGLQIPPFVRMDGVAVCHSHLPADTADGDLHPEAGSSRSMGNSNTHRYDDVSRSAADATWGFQLTIRSVHGHTCIMPMVKAVTVQVDAKDAAAAAVQVEVLRVGNALASQQQQAQQQQAADSRETEQAQKGNADTASAAAMHHVHAAAQTLGTSQNQQQQPQQAPCNGVSHAGSLNCCATAVSPAVQGGVPVGGPYEFSVSNIPSSVQQIECRVQLHLVEWADADKREVQLPVYSVTQSSTVAVAAAEAGGGVNVLKQEQLDNTSKQEEVLGGVTHTAAGLPQQTAHPASSMEELDVQIAAALDAAGVALPCQADDATLQALNLIPALEVKRDALGDMAGRQEQAVQQQQDQGAESIQQDQGSALGNQPQSDEIQPQPGAALQGKTAGEAGRLQGGGVVDSSASVTNKALVAGGHPTVLARMPQLAIYTFITQVVHLDAAKTWHAFETNPPPVVQPAQKKQKATPERSGPDAASALPLRRSGRRRNSTARAASADVSAFENGEDVEAMDQDQDEDEDDSV